MAKGQLIVYTGASGVGKGTIMEQLLADNSNLRLSVSATTRAPRPGEVDGVNYFFLFRIFINSVSIKLARVSAACTRARSPFALKKLRGAMLTRFPLMRPPLVPDVRSPVPLFTQRRII